MNEQMNEWGIAVKGLFTLSLRWDAASWFLGDLSKHSKVSGWAQKSSCNSAKGRWNQAQYRDLHLKDRKVFWKVRIEENVETHNLVSNSSLSLVRKTSCLAGDMTPL